MRHTAEPTLLVGKSSAICSLRQDIAYASRSDAKVLITGESGVGKEIVARSIHAMGARKHNPLVTVNCAALTETLLETELFGHVRGSFTGAYRDRAGVFEAANRGTVFMDEIGETTPRMQGLLLRFLETGEIQRVGSDDRVQAKLDVRVIAATNRVLIDAVAARTFREDLYYRLNVIHLQVPPLRDRREDIPDLLEFFLAGFSRQYAVESLKLCPVALKVLTEYAWPGNVRELKNVVERTVVRSRSDLITAEDLPVEVLRRRTGLAPATATTSAAAPADALTIAEVLFDAMVSERQSFWDVVYRPFMSRDVTRSDVRKLVRMGLERTSGNYKVMTELFNLQPQDYKRFLSFLRKYDCQIGFQEFRTAGPARAECVAASRRIAASL